MKSVKNSDASFRWIERLVPEERATLAKDRIRVLAGHVQELLHMHESNRVLIYSDTVASKIPKSFAAHTYTLLSDTVHRYQLTRLCALWDSAKGSDRASLPVVIELIRDWRVRRIIAKDKCEWRNNRGARILNPSSDPEILTEQVAANDYTRRKFAFRDAKKCNRSLLKCISDCDRMLCSNELTGLRDFRDTYVAHHLQFDQKTAEAKPAVKWGQEEQVLERSLELVSQLALDLTGTHYSWEEFRKHFRRCADELWNNIRFEIDYTESPPS